VQVATQAAEAGEGGVRVGSAVDERAVAGFDADVAAVEDCALVVVGEAVEGCVLACRLDPHADVGHAVAGEARPQQAAEGAARANRGDGAPPLRSAMGRECLVQ
jgi:hypothetical protein